MNQREQDLATAVFYWNYLTTKGCAPTFREIAVFRGCALGQVHRHLERMEEAGYIPGFRRKPIHNR